MSQASDTLRTLGSVLYRYILTDVAPGCVILLLAAAYGSTNRGVVDFAVALSFIPQVSGGALLFGLALVMVLVAGLLANLWSALALNWLIDSDRLRSLMDRMLTRRGQQDLLLMAETIAAFDDRTVIPRLFLLKEARRESPDMTPREFVELVRERTGLWLRQKSLEDFHRVDRGGAMAIMCRTLAFIAVSVLGIEVVRQSSIGFTREAVVWLGLLVLVALGLIVGSAYAFEYRTRGTLQTASQRLRERDAEAMSLAHEQARATIHQAAVAGAAASKLLT